MHSCSSTKVCETTVATMRVQQHHAEIHLLQPGPGQGSEQYLRTVRSARTSQTVRTARRDSALVFTQLNHIACAKATVRLRSYGWRLSVDAKTARFAGHLRRIQFVPDSHSSH